MKDISQSTSRYVFDWGRTLNEAPDAFGALDGAPNEDVSKLIACLKRPTIPNNERMLCNEAFKEEKEDKDDDDDDDDEGEEMEDLEEANLCETEMIFICHCFKSIFPVWKVVAKAYNVASVPLLLSKEDTVKLGLTITRRPDKVTKVCNAFVGVSVGELDG